MKLPSFIYNAYGCQLVLTGVFVLLFLFANAQTDTTFLDNRTDAVAITGGLFYVDSTCSADFTQTSNPAFAKHFTASNLEQTEVQPDVNCYWVKFVLQNQSAATNEWLIDYDKWLSADVYVANGTSGFTRSLTGHIIPYNQKSIHQANRNLVAIKLLPGEAKEVYIKLVTGYNYMQRPGNLSGVVYRESSVIEHQDGVLKIIYFFSGIYVVMLLYNFFVFYSIREKSYLYYLYLIFFSLFALWENTGYTVPLFRSITNFPSWLTNIDLVSSSLFGIAILLFTRNFLKTKEFSPVIDKLFNIIMLVLLLILLLPFAGYSFAATNISGLLGMFTSVVILVAAIRSYRKKYPSAGIFLLANTFFMISIFVYLVLSIFKDTQSFLFNFSIPIGSAIQIILFSLALGNRINVLKAQNEASQHEIIEQLRLYAELQDKTNRELEQKVEERTGELRNSQKQLLQQEKLASLGEVTAGVAHEIQNPLNFIKNFSELNKDLADEMEEEIAAGNTNMLKEISGNIKFNSEKILEHGARVDSIVKGMLQHARLNSGSKEKVTINAMCDEYISLAFHGLKAKDKNFTAEISKSYDDTLGEANINRQDLGRVLLNLLNNAFYAVAEKQVVAGKSYVPSITVSTQKKEKTFCIAIHDNGAGIPQKIANKIFQPFFTTKPTGKGTGLGLSMSYQIVKEHEGGLTVNTEEGNFTEFVVTLPL